MEIVARAFLSYAHADNDREGGRILRLRDQIRDEFETLTGTTIKIFTDDEEIQWGDDFRAVLDEALQETTFFIPVLTPTYFLRDECRKEMRQFTSSATALGLTQLLLSIRYIPVPDLREGSADELKAIAARMQYENWDGLRLLDEDSAQYRTAINRLATRLVDLTQRLESVGQAGNPEPGAELIALPDEPVSTEQEASEPEPQAIRLNAEEGEEDEAPGLIDQLADVDPAMNEWGETLGQLAPATERFNALFTATTEEMTVANSRPNAFAAKVVIARKLAADIEEPLADLERISKEYSTGLLRLDPAIRALIEMVPLQEDPEQARAFLTGLEGMIEAAREATVGVLAAADAAKANAGLSRDLRPVLRRYETAMRNIVDGTSVIEEWQPLIDAAA